MIIVKNNIFVINTKNTTYAFRVIDTGHLEHLYYGTKIRLGENLEGVEGLCEKHTFAPGNTISYDQEHLNFTPEDICLEMSTYGKGDIREPFIEIVNSDGSRTSDFLFDSYEIRKEKTELKCMPSAYEGAEDVEELAILLKDAENKLSLEIRYAVFNGTDVITRSAKLTNNGKAQVRLDRIMSLMLDMPDSDYTLSTFHGSWTREMQKVDRPVLSGKYVGSSMTGTSSNRNNPFFMVAKNGTTENYGEVYGFNLIYSGNHYEAVEVNGFGKTRIVNGINPASFEYIVGPDESFETPEAVMSYSKQGYNGLSQNMHQFVRNHIVRGEWQFKNRPILLNSWEAAYFDINEDKLLAFAKKAAKAGIELFVMDDGWFGKRNDDTTSLGDWFVDTKKLPNGLQGLCSKINKLGLDFGIWVEPEMINVNSELYTKHPDWCLDIPGKKHSEGRNQRVLDYTRKDVQDYIIDAMKKVFSSANITYVKWDMNRSLTDYFSKNLPDDRQGEVAHRYVLGLYRVAKELTEAFPHILFEGCSGGGNRFDLGMLCYFPQIWGSDNTDAICRAEIQNGYSYGYPPETVGSHVSGCPNHQTLRKTPIDTRFAVASFGSLGYECNLIDMPKEEVEAVRQQVALYKMWRDDTQFGSFYRGRTFDKGNICEWTVVSRDKKNAIGMVLQKLVRANSQYEYYKAAGLDEETLYHFTNLGIKHNIKAFGDLVNTVSPVHIKQDSLVYNTISKFYKMDGETEDYYMYGDSLMSAGVKLKQAFSGTGYNDQVRYFQDFASRLYFMEAE